jgi:hypothetical protein
MINVWRWKLHLGEKRIYLYSFFLAESGSCSPITLLAYLKIERRTMEILPTAILHQGCAKESSAASHFSIGCTATSIFPGLCMLLVMV